MVEICFFLSFFIACYKEADFRLWHWLWSAALWMLSTACNKKHHANMNQTKVTSPKTLRRWDISR